MTDIQRYGFYGNWDGEAVEEEDHNGEYVKYDDHIAEKEKWLKRSIAMDDAHTELQERIDELEYCIKRYLREEIGEMQLSDIVANKLEKGDD